MSKSKILIVDDHAIFREGLANILSQQDDLVICAQAEDSVEGLKAAQSHKPDMAIVDISLEGTSGLELTQTLRQRFPTLRILILSMHKETLYAERALHAGANGYLMKQESGKTLLAAIRSVLRGETYVSPEVEELLEQNSLSTSPDDKGSPIERLSRREFEVFGLIARGYGTRQMADQLHLSMKTIETHREHIREKLNLKTTFELVQYALAWAAEHPQ